MIVIPLGDEVRSLLPPDAVIDCLASGFSLTEGPVWHPDGYLLFSEIPSSSRLRWDEEGGARVVAHPTHRANGSALAPDGALFACEHETSCVVRLTLTPAGEVADREVVASHYGGKELNSPNDVVVRSDGIVFFTDPTYGREQDWVGKVRAVEQDVQGVYAVLPGSAPRLLVDDFNQPNGLCFSPDESVLYVNDSAEYHIRRFFITPNLEAIDCGVLISGVGDARDPSLGFCDGMKCDQLGNVWVTGPGGIWIISPRGEHLGTVKMPEQCHNLAWGGPEFNEAFVMGSLSIYRFRTSTAGAHRPRTS
jgi:gluconolactonase